MFLRIACATVAALCWAAPQTLWADAAISLHDAVRLGKVKVDVKSRGGATGPTVRVEVQRLVGENLQIEVVPGTVLLNAENSEQNVSVGQLKGEFTGENKYRPGKVMVLADGQKRSFLLEVYCLDYAKKAPRKGGSLALAMRDSRVARILNPPPGVQPTLAAVQIAIWMDRAGISPEEARKRYRGTTTDVDVQIARQLLVHAEKTGVESIPPDMPTDVRVHVQKLFSPDPTVRAGAAELLGQMGADALPAVSFLAENLLDRTTDKPLPGNVVRVDVNVAARNAQEVLKQLGLPGLAPLIEAVRVQVESGVGGAASGGDPDAAAEPPAATEEGQPIGGVLGDALVDRLIDRLGNRRATVRERAAWLLGTTGNRRAVEPLMKLLTDDSEQVRTTAADALKAITSQDFGTNADQWLEWWKKNQ